ncbi:MAG: c-type cytochrome [Candidatus Sericytochromatia bacterium]|nr:c-type cytochrome [Candidatus Tanganyikabacteria bacterium]
MSQPEPTKRPHSADGIEEYDNPLPRWWVWLFYGTILFSVGYWICYPTIPGLGGALGWSQLKVYAREVAAVPKPAAAGAGSAEKLLADPAALAAGRDVYRRACASCHGPDGKGLIGPSLVDEAWVRGTGEVADILDLVNTGTSKGMPGWKGQLPPADIERVAAFVHGLSHPADPHHPALP